jgi:glycosyltransferase involved in cell wall biosynthesis
MGTIRARGPRTSIDRALKVTVHFRPAAIGSEHSCAARTAPFVFSAAAGVVSGSHWIPMKILFVLGQLPYPPRNGVTIPTYNFLTGLAAHHDVSLLLIPDGTRESKSGSLEENATLVDNLWQLDAPLKPKLTRIVDELTGRSIYHIGRHYDRSTLERLFADHGFDVVWMSNSAIFDAVHPIREILGTDPIYVAGLNDSLTEGFRGAIRLIGLRGWSIRDRISLFFRWLRSWRLGSIEKKLLAPFDLILVQSARDEQMVRRVSGGSADRIMVLSNGVDGKLFAISQGTRNKDLLFVGSLRGYSPLVEWILMKVWPTVRERHADATFTIIGRDASRSLLRVINGDQRIRYVPFVQDLEDIYKDRMISILPVRKSSGLINKVVESMAAGLPVVGDAGSFNALPGFEDGTHGIVAGDSERMTQAVLRLLDDESARTEMAAAAKKLIKANFAWQDRIRMVEERLHSWVQRRGG